MLRQLDRYVTTRFAKVLFVALASFVLIYVVVDLIDHLDDFLSRETPFLQIARYYVNYVPYILVLTLPLGVLLATLFVVGEMGSSFELVAIRAAGISIYRVAVPLLRTGLLISIASLLLAELVVPRSNEIRSEILELSTSNWIGGQLRNITRQDRSGYILYAARYDNSRRTAHNVSIILVRHHKPVRRIDADVMTWDADGWLLRGVTDRHFNDGETGFARHTSMRLPELTLQPEDLARVDKPPEQMSFLELYDYIDRMRLVGGEADRWLVDLYLKIAFPLASLLMVWIGFPIAARSWRGGKAIYIGLTLLIGFLFFVGVRAGQALGRSGDLNPIIGAWGSDGLFALIGLVLFRWTRR